MGIANVKAYLYPFRSKNKFVDINKTALSKLGFNVNKVDVFFILDLLRLKRDQVVVLNWVEDRVYGRSFKRFLQTFIGLALLIIFSKLFARKVIWVRHNFFPHAESKNNYRYRFLCKLYDWLSIKAIPLESYYSTPALVHPLYRSDESIKNEIANGKRSDNKKEIPVLFFGAIKKYKNLHDTLDIWPKNIPLKIAGYCDDIDYQRLLQNKINDRELDVDWTNKFLSAEELDGLLKRAMYVLLPHADNAMISSGSFYHAIGEGCNVITNSSQFGHYKQQQHEFVNTYNFKDLTTELLISKYIHKVDVMAEALKFYGEDKVVDAWQKILFEVGNT